MISPSLGCSRFSHNIILMRIATRDWTTEHSNTKDRFAIAGIKHRDGGVVDIGYCRDLFL